MPFFYSHLYFAPYFKLLYLRSTFSPQQTTKGFSLQISHGRGGSKLNHNHATQFMFANQTLTLWRNIMDQFFSLWLLAEDDLLSARSGYRLANTGQGLQRCQSAPGKSFISFLEFPRIIKQRLVLIAPFFVSSFLIYSLILMFNRVINSHYE